MGKYWSSRNTAAIGAPRLPPCTNSRSARNTGALRRTRPLWAGTPASRTASVRAIAEGRSRSRGFSQKTGRPATSAASTAERCAAVGVHTQRTSQQRATSAASATASAPSASAKPSARPLWTSWTAVIDASSTPPSIIAFRPSPCAQAMRPVPTKPTRSMVGHYAVSTTAEFGWCQRREASESPQSDGDLLRIGRSRGDDAIHS